MKKIFLLLYVALPVFLLSSTLQAQIPNVNFNVVKNDLNEGNLLPAEEAFFIRGALPKDIHFVEVKVKPSDRRTATAHHYNWKTAFDFRTDQYELFVSEPLKSNERYDFEFAFYELASKEDMKEVKTLLGENLRSYLKANLEVTASGIRSFRSDRVILRQLDAIVEQGLTDYRHYLDRDFQGFSDVVKHKLAQKDKIRLRRARFNIIRSERGTQKEEDKAVYAATYMEELFDLVENELEQYLSRSLLTLVDIRSVRNYPTERLQNSLPLNVGYGAFAVRRSLGSTQYFNGPYVGLSLPLGNTTFTKFLGNASLSAGVFVQNFEAEGMQISGPFVNLPIYVGLGYRAFNVLRFNAGAVLIDMENGGSGTIYAQPFVGLSLELNLWLGFNQKKR
ncbi:MAG: hypothetical protein ACXIT9_00495 [Nitritalea sp.]